jgi:predicted RNase H-like HicB family nuclease
MTVNVILEKTESNWCAFTPDDIGVVFSTAPTREAVIESFRDALKGHLEAMREEGLETPTVENLNIQELIAV